VEMSWLLSAKDGSSEEIECIHNDGSIVYHHEDKECDEHDKVSHDSMCIAASAATFMASRITLLTL